MTTRLGTAIFWIVAGAMHFVILAEIAGGMAVLGPPALPGRLRLVHLARHPVGR